MSADVAGAFRESESQPKIESAEMLDEELDTT